MPVAQETWTEVTAEAPETGRVLAEIDLYLAGVARMWVWLNYVHQSLGPWDETLFLRHVGRFDDLRNLWINKLPTLYDLKKSYIHWYPPTHCYCTQYVLPSAMKESRQVVLANVIGLLKYMRVCEAKIEEDQSFPKDRKSACKQYMKEAEEMFETWMEKARPHVIPSQGALRGREETGRRPGTAPAAYKGRGAGAPTPELAHMQALLREMQDCTRVGV